MAGSSKLPVAALLVGAVLGLAGLGFVGWRALAARETASVALAGPDRVEPDRAEGVATDRKHARDETTGLTAPARATSTVPAVETEGRAAVPSAEPEGRAAVEADAGELARARWVAGRVILPAELPADERVRVVARGEPRFPTLGDHAVELAADGSFRVAFQADAKDGRLELDARYTFLAEPFEVSPALLALGEEADIVLEPQLGACLIVTVRPPTGAGFEERPQDLPPRMDAVAIARRTDGGTSRRSSGAAPNERAAYVAVLGGIPPRIEHSLFCHVPSWQPMSGASFQLEAGELREVEVQASFGAQVVGRVVDEHGRGLAGAEVTVRTTFDTPAGRRPGTRLTRPILTAADGAFDIGGLHPGRTVVHATLQGRLPDEHDAGTLDDGTYESDIELVLDAGRSLSGRVTWPDGTGAAGARLVLDDGQPNRLPFDEPESRTTDDDGRFTIGGLGRDPVRLTATAPGDTCPGSTPGELGPTTAPWIATLEHVEPDTHDLLLVLDAGLAIEGTVVDQDGAPLGTFTIAARLVGSELPEDRRQQLFETRDGRFALRGLTPGTWHLSASNDEHAPTHALSVKLPSSKRVELVAHRGVSIAGRVVAANGGAVAGARVSAHVPGMLSLSVTDKSDWKRANVVSAEDGSFAIHGLAPGSVQLEARQAGYARSEPMLFDLAPGAAENNVLIELPQGGRIEGRLHPRPGAELADRSVDLMPVRLSSTSYIDHASTDASGSFLFVDVPAGTHSLLCPPYEQTVLVENGRTTEVVLGGTAAPGEPRIFGTVTRAGEPVPDARVQVVLLGASAPEVHRAITAADGRYVASISGPGLFGLHASDGGAGTHVRVEVPESGAARCDVELPLGALRGTVLAVDGTPAADVWIRAYASEQASGRVRSAADGSFAIEGLPGGTYTLSAAAWSDHLPVAPYVSPKLAVELEHDAATDGIELRLLQPSTIEGRVFLPTGEPAVDTTVTLVPEVDGRQERAQAETDATGRYRIYCAEGRWRLHARKEFLGSGASDTIATRTGVVVEHDLTLAPGTIVQVVIDGIDDPIRAGVTASDGASALPASFFNQELAELGGNPRGARFGPLPPGTYRAVAQRTTADAIEADGTFTLDGEGYVEVELERK